ncbi:MAG TPA: hypothetical protein VFY92_07030 [Hyphomicrobiaceae bacterium]|nr:hypothetical protein [Hyphomicrobiaceae bacterium]
MTDLVKALTGTDKATIDFLAVLLILIGGFLMIGGYVFRVFVHPEWSFEQATATLWPYFAGGAVSLTLGWIVDRTGETITLARVRRPQGSAPQLPAADQ